MEPGDFKDVIEKIENLVREPGFVYTLALVLIRDLFFDPEEVADIDWHEHLNFQEITFLAGLLIKHEIDLNVPSQEQSEKQFVRIDDLFLELREKHSKRFMEKMVQALNEKEPHRERRTEEEYRATFGTGTMMTEPIFYSGSGAYDFQYLGFAVNKYKNDSEWIWQHVGIDVSIMTDVARALKKLQESNYKSSNLAASDSFSELCKKALSIFCFTQADLSELFTSEIVQKFVEAFALSPGEVNSSLELPGQYNELQGRPIVRFPDGRYFLPVAFSISEAVYEDPFYWMNRDSKYRDYGLRNRGDFAQEATAQLLRDVFGKDNVYTQVQVERSKGQTITDIDVLAVAGDKAVIAQVKSKRLTELARLGNDEKLREDFKVALQDAYNQAILSRRALIDHSDKLLTNGHELSLGERPDDAYILCVTLDHYPAVAHQVDVYLKKPADHPFPVAISIFDLDTLSFYLRDPFEFLYYLRQRTQLSKYFKADSEMALLGFHLKHKLYKQKEADFVALDPSFAQLIDANFPVLRGSVPNTSAAEKLRPEWKNDDFKLLIDQIKSANDVGFTEAIFFLYDMAGKGADDLIEMIKRVKKMTAADGRTHDASALCAEGRAGFTILCEPSSTEMLWKKLMSLAMMRKYKSRANVWLALGCLSGSQRLVDAVAFNRDPWQEDKGMEQAIAKHLPHAPRAITPSGRKIRRNEPCPCGSGKKYKHCHGL